MLFGIFKYRNSWHALRMAEEREQRQERKSISMGSERLRSEKRWLSERELVAIAVVKEAFSSHSGEAAQRGAS